jgi:hypothetical protein
MSIGVSPMPNPPEAAPPPKRGHRLGLTCALGLVVLQAAFRLIPELRPGTAGVVCWLLGLELVPLLAAAVLAVWLVASALWRPFFRLSRVIGFVLLAALGISDRLYVTYPSSHDYRPSRVAFRLPLDGPVTVFWGGPTEDVNYHVGTPEQRWAYDLLVMREGLSHKGSGAHLTDYYCYDLPVLAPAGGEVVFVSDNDPDMPPGTLGGGTSPGGNQVIIKVAPGEYLWLCHMQPRSVLVKKGDRVSQGQPIGKVGNSGNTSEPHVHIDLEDGREGEITEGIPLEFHHYRVDGHDVAKGIPTGGFRGNSFIGQVVENVPLHSAADRSTPEAPPTALTPH